MTHHLPLSLALTRLVELVGADEVVGHGTLSRLRIFAVQVVKLLSVQQRLLILAEVERPDSLLHALFISVLADRRRVTRLVARVRLTLVRLLLAVHLLLDLKHDLVVGVISTLATSLEALLAHTSLAARLERTATSSGRIPRRATSIGIRCNVVVLRGQCWLRVDDQVVVDLVTTARWPMRTLALVLLLA